jgi:hypothetical protein
MAVSTVPATKAKLVQLFQASASLGGATPHVRVTWAAPTRDEEYQNDHVWLGRTRQVEEFRTLGAQRIDEEYTIDIVIQAYRSGNDEQAVETRWWVMREAVVAALRADLSLGGTVNGWVGPFPTDDVEPRPAAPKGWLCKGTVSLTCRARI